MIKTGFYDIETEPIIRVEDFYGPERHVIDKCLIIFSKEIFVHLLETFKCEHIADIGACIGAFPIYAFDYEGEKIGFYLTGVGAPMASSMCYEASHITGAKKFIMFGSCGSLDGDKTKGKFIVPTESYRGEGTSHYFAPDDNDYITVKNSDKVAKIFEELGVPYVQGRVWTTDVMLRETVGLVERRRQEGCIAVEMELAGVQSICDFYGLEVYDFLESGDVLSESGYEVEGLNAANHNLEKVYIALKMAKML